MVVNKFDAIKAGTGEDLVTLTRWVISQQQVKYVQVIYTVTNMYIGCA